MPKAKTIKCVAKRIKITKNKKLLKKTSGQDHFNSREPGKVTRQKRKDRTISNSYKSNIWKFLPNSK
jgi:ribosomal protein L35